MKQVEDLELKSTGFDIDYCLQETVDDICLICQEGYFLTNNVCTQLTCPLFLPNCLECDSEYCTLCRSGYYLKED